jgi:endonuclease YncB( thermonuclease family)
LTPKQFKRFLAVGIVSFLLLLPYATEASADSLTGKVVKITDGDTLYVLDANYEQHQNPFSRD